MKTLKLLVLLALFSLQAGATGYSHNMFVAHKKLQAGKEAHAGKVHTFSKKIHAFKADVKYLAVGQENQSAVQQFATQVGGMVTLNERILKEGPLAFFQGEDAKETDDSIVSRLVSSVRGLVIVFARSFFG